MEPLPPTSRGIFTGRVIRRRQPCREHFDLTIRVDRFPDAQPGQFVQLLCATPLRNDEKTVVEDDPPSATLCEAQLLLRRPFSIGGLERQGVRCDISILGRVIGAGTAWLAARMPGDEINFIGPLGVPFRRLDRGQRALLVAGGVGLPPILWLGRVLCEFGVKTQAIYGAQSRDLIPLTLTDSPAKQGDFSACAAEFALSGIDTLVTTNDGSFGVKGLVTDALSAVLDRPGDQPDAVYACGPEPMLHAVADVCAQRSVECQVALERMMGCGMGTCQSCVVRVVDEQADAGWRYALCCAEGPVFDAARVCWAG